MDNQNQNTSSAQPQNAGGLQGQTATIPVTNTNIQGAGAISFGGNSNAVELLNQTQVLSSSASSSTPAKNTAVEPKSDGFPVNYALLALVVLIIMTVLFRWWDARAKKA